MNHPNHNTTISQQVNLQEALRIAQARHIAIVPTARSVMLWAPGVRVPGQVRLAIMANRQEVRRLVGQSHALVCPSPTLHGHSFGYRVRRECCEICAKLNYWQSLACSENKKSA
jgi:hypothetical protein